MSFYDEHYRYHDDYKVRELHKQKQELEQEIQDKEWRQFSAECERERQMLRDRQHREAEREETRNILYSLQEDLDDALALVADLRLRIKYGVEVE